MVHLQQKVKTNDGRIGVVTQIQPIAYGGYTGAMCYISGKNFGDWYLDKFDNGQLTSYEESVVCPTCKGKGVI